MTTFDAILEAHPQPRSRQLSIDELLAEIEVENRDDPNVIASAPHACEVEADCHALLGVGGNYKCGWLATDVSWCPRRKRLISGGER